jgi:hypothetical protein
MDLASHHPIDLTALLETRLLLQANSGGGKSWVLRRILEQTANSVQQLVIDPEGEFSTLREKLDYVIAAPHDGDALATPATASLLARRLLESGSSAILDIYDLKAHERIAFVRNFLDALVNAPKSLWHPVLVALDEAHVYAPQSTRAESSGAVIDIATRGRKRGQCLIAATQRISKLHKDVAAELGNKMIGRTGLDVDVKRAADELGLASREATESLRNMQPGEFYVFGPALSRSVVKMRVGPVQTSHPKAGHRLMAAPPPPSAKLKAQLAKLADLQKDAEHEAHTIDELKGEVTRLRRDLTIANRRASEAGVPEEEVRARINAAVADATKSVSAAAPNDAALAALRKIHAAASEVLSKAGSDAARERRASPIRAVLPDTARPATAGARSAAADSTGDFSGPQVRILDSLGWWFAFGIDAPTRVQVAAVANYSPNGTAFTNPLGALRTAGLVDYPSPGAVRLTDEGRQKARMPATAPSVAELHARVRGILSGPQQRILGPLLEAYPSALSRADLASRASYSPDGTAFTNPLGALRSLGFVDYPQPGMCTATPLLFPRVAPKERAA